MLPRKSAAASASHRHARRMWPRVCCFAFQLGKQQLRSWPCMLGRKCAPGARARPSCVHAGPCAPPLVSAVRLSVLHTRVRPCSSASARWDVRTSRYAGVQPAGPLDPEDGNLSLSGCGNTAGRGGGLPDASRGRASCPEGCPRRGKPVPRRRAHLLQ
jgi:hypothetical protein